MSAEIFSIGVDAGGTATKGGVVSLDGRVVIRTERPTDGSAGTKGIIAVVEELLERATGDGIEVEAVGVGVAGFVDQSTGSVSFSPNVTYDDPHIRAALSARVDLPVVVDNDANAATWGETKVGAAAGAGNVAMLTIGTGIGSGFVVDEALLRGHSGAGAEAGHMIVDIDGPPCTCGLRGCLEQFASGTAIGRAARAAAEKNPGTSMISFAGSIEAITAEHTAKAARQLDESARDVLRRAGRALGIGLSNIANIFDPELIVLAGSVIGAGEPFLGPARDELARLSQAQRRRAMRLDVSRLRTDAGIIGAALIAGELLDA